MSIRLAAIVVASSVGVFASSTLCAQGLSGLPSKSWSSWSQQEQSEGAELLKNHCAEECAPYLNEAKGGSIRATYEASACNIACFVNNLPADWPPRDQYISAARENYKNAQQLGSNAPVFLRSDR